MDRATIRKKETVHKPSRFSSPLAAAEADQQRDSTPDWCKNTSSANFQLFAQTSNALKDATSESHLPHSPLEIKAAI